MSALETGGVNPSSREGYSQTGDWMAPKKQRPLFHEIRFIFGFPFISLLLDDEEPLGRNCRGTLLTQLTDRFFG